MNLSILAFSHSGFKDAVKSLLVSAFLMFFGILIMPPYYITLPYFEPIFDYNYYTALRQAQEP
jgi:hypothetical protein